MSRTFFISLILFSLCLLTFQSGYEKIELKYYDEFLNFTKNFNPNGRVINFYFYGEKNETGISFCSDCVAAEIHVNKALEQYGDNTVFVAVNIGNKDMWKDKSNSFRTDEIIGLTSIPTLLRWNHQKGFQMKTLEERELLKEDYLEWFFYVHENLSKNSSNSKVERYDLKNYSEFLKFTKNFNSKKKPLSFYFYGAKNETGNSFCPDCDAAEPVVEKALERFGESTVFEQINMVFVEVSVGDYKLWKDKNNPFRTDTNILLTRIPTMIRWDDSKKRLEEIELLDEGNFEWFFSMKKARG